MAGVRLRPGAVVTQATSKSTGVILHARCGQITTHAASLAATTSVTFEVTNSVIRAHDIPVVAIASGGTTNSYSITVEAVAAGSCKIQIRNVTAGALAETLVLNFGVIGGGVG